VAGVTAASSAAATKMFPFGGTPSTAQWSAAVLTAAQLPVNVTNVSNLNAWIANEQTASSWSQGVNGVHGPLGNMQGNATNPAEAAIQTAQHLTTSSYYTNIVKALQHSVPLALFAGAVTSTPWNAPTDYGGVTTFINKAKANNYGNYTASGTNAASPGAGNPKGWFGQWIEPTLTGSIVGLHNNPAVPIANTVIAPFKAAGSVGQLISDITNPTTLKNVGIFVAGFCIAGVGLLIFFSQTKTAKTVEGAAVKAA
jgi:hypothetical protein